MARPGDEGRLSDWLESLQRDVDRLKARQSAVSIGAWVVEVNDAGALVARNTATGSVTTIAGA